MLGELEFLKDGSRPPPAFLACILPISGPCVFAMRNTQQDKPDFFQLAIVPRVRALARSGRQIPGTGCLKPALNARL